MRVPQERTLGLAKALGILLMVVLPLVIASELHTVVRLAIAPADYALVFLSVSAGGQFGLIVRRWGNINLWVLLLDLLLSGVAGVISYAVVDLAVRRGGAMVNPALLAVIMAYVLVIWSGQHR